MGYAGLIDAESGDTHLTDRAYLTYTYIRHGEAFDRRYLVFQSVQLSLRDSPVNPQVGLALARWLDPKSGRRRSTVGPGSPLEWQSQLETTTGYLMTRANV